MEPPQAVFFLGVFASVGVLAIGVRMVAASLRHPHVLHTSGERRAGDDEHVDLEAAASRARGTTAWMRPDGGGF